MDYPRYYKFYLKNFYQNKTFRAFILMAQGIFSAFVWMFSGPILLIAIIFGILNISLLAGKILIIFIIIYAPIQYYLILKKYREIMIYTTSKTTNKRSLLEYITIPLLSIIVIILSSIPPYLSLFMEICKVIFNIKLKKPKPESA